MLSRNHLSLLLRGVPPLLALLFLSTPSFAQCGQFIEGDTIMVSCGDSAHLTLEASALSGELFEDFNDKSIDSGFATSSNPDYSEPCEPSLDSTPYAWFGPNSNMPRTIRTIDIPVDSGTKVCFDLLFAEQGNSSPCEGPDLPDEGVSLEYSSDSGSTWNEIFYFNPDTACCGCGGPCGGYPPSPFVDWKNYCFSIPNSVAGSSIRIRWYQSGGSGIDYDHWGLDDLAISSGGKDSSLVYDWGNGFTNRNDSSFLPTDTSTYTVKAIDTVDKDTCTASAYVGYIPLQAGIEPTNPNKCGSDSIKLSAEHPLVTCNYQLVMKDAAADGWNGAAVTVYRNGSPISTHSASGGGTTDTIPLSGLDTLSLEYSSGTSDSENSYALLNPAGDTLFQDGPTPKTGLVYTEGLACNKSGNYTYDWSTGAGLSDTSTPTVSTGIDSPMTYTLTVKDSNHAFCTNSDTVMVDTGSSPDPNILADSGFCVNNKDTLSLSGSYASAVWNDNIHSSELVVDSSFGYPSQEHWVKVTDTNGCEGTDSIMIESLPSPMLDLGSDTTLCADSGITFYSSYSNALWDDGSTGPSHYVDTSKAVLGTSQHWAEVTNDSGCTDSDTVTVTFTICSSLKEAGREGSIKVMPNPVSETVRIQREGASFHDGTPLELFDAKGRKVLEKEPKEGSHRVLLEVSALPSGAYFLHMEWEGNIYRKKLIVR